MSEARKHIHELHEEIKGWKAEMTFIKDVLKTLDNRLLEVASRNTNKEVLAQIEHFQNQFLRQNEVTDELAHTLNEAEHVLVREVQSFPSASHRLLMSDQTFLREQVFMHHKIFQDLRAEFNGFAGRWL